MTYLDCPPATAGIQSGQCRCRHKLGLTLYLKATFDCFLRSRYPPLKRIDYSAGNRFNIQRFPLPKMFQIHDLMKTLLHEETGRIRAGGGSIGISSRWTIIAVVSQPAIAPAPIPGNAPDRCCRSSRHLPTVECGSESGDPLVPRRARTGLIGSLRATFRPPDCCHWHCT